MDRQEGSLNRRHFLRQSGCAALGVTGLVNSLSHLLLTEKALAQSTYALGDYKALVVLFLFGGNDSNNTLIPAAGHPARSNYQKGRGILAIPADQLHPLHTPSAANSQYGLHPNLAAMAALFNQQDLAFVANVGTMVEPIPNRDAYLKKTVILPPKLFSHSDQQLQWQSSVPDQPFTSGWGGRVADLLNPAHNNTSNISMSISLSGVNRLQVGHDVIQYMVSESGITEFADAGYGHGYASALDGSGGYRNNNQGRRLRAFEQIMAYSHAHLLEEGYNNVVRRARQAEGFVGDALAQADASVVDFDFFFQNATSALGRRLKMIARLIAGRDALSNERQIFFVSIGGYDNHAGQTVAHGNLMTELGESLRAFSNTLKVMQVNDKVMTVTHSDFARTFTANKEDIDSAGSDHAWGGHQIVMGGPVDGGKIYGTFPDLAIQGKDDADNKGRGRWIPTTSVEQYQAVATNWLGVSAEDLHAIFPNLNRFEDPFSSAANLGYVAQSGQSAQRR